MVWIIGNELTVFKGMLQKEGPYVYANLEKQLDQNSNSSTLSEEGRKEDREEGRRRRRMGEAHLGGLE